MMILVLKYQLEKKKKKNIQECHCISALGGLEFKRCF